MTALIDKLSHEWLLDEVSDGTSAVTRVDNVGSIDLTDVNTVKGGASGATFAIADSTRLEASHAATLEPASGSFMIEIQEAETTAPQAVQGGVMAKDGSYRLAALDSVSRWLFRVNTTAGTLQSAPVGADYTLGESDYLQAGITADGKVFLRVNNTEIEIATGRTYSAGTGDFAVGMGLFPGYFFEGLIKGARFWDTCPSAYERNWLCNGTSGRTLTQIQAYRRPIERQSYFTMQPF